MSGWNIVRASQRQKVVGVVVMIGEDGAEVAYSAHVVDRIQTERRNIFIVGVCMQGSSASATNSEPVVPRTTTPSSALMLMYHSCRTALI